ncbi:hypothetical protein ACGFZK_09520 [Streptomyces sp. NPDC048257]|uniref:hypothetical protein n=1 Tax=Streptomyces sp. NPDC048257 TaxID=3365526 RepID=UPI00370FD93E
MADARRTALRISVGSLLRPGALGPRLLTQTLAVVARSARRHHRVSSAATCENAAEYRSFSGGEAGAGSGVTGEPRCRDSSAGAAGRRERAHEAVASRTTSPRDLASLLAMLDLQTGPDGKKARPEDG